MKEENEAMNRFLRSFLCAFFGVRQFVRERNAKIMVAGVCAAAVMVWVAPLLAWRALIVFVATSVIAVEMFNSAIERLLDYIAPQKSPEAKYIKDVMAAASLAMSLGALVVGIMFFIALYSGGQS